MARHPERVFLREGSPSRGRYYYRAHSREPLQKDTLRMMVISCHAQGMIVLLIKKF